MMRKSIFDSVRLVATLAGSIALARVLHPVAVTEQEGRTRLCFWCLCLGFI
jgi:hypothetical protein